MFQKKCFEGMWKSDTMDSQTKSLFGNRYAQVFSNGTSFSEIYPMDRKVDAGVALEKFTPELGVPERLTIDDSKEHNSPSTD